MARSDGLESSHASPCAGFSLRAGRDYHSCRRRRPVFLLLGFPAATALVVDRDGPPTHSILALARAATPALTQVRNGLRLFLPHALPQRRRRLDATQNPDVSGLSDNSGSEAFSVRREAQPDRTKRRRVEPPLFRDVHDRLK